jgi:hypothetical protein
MAEVDFLALEPGSVIEAGRLLPAITPEPVVHEVMSVDPDKGTVRLSCSWFGVHIGQLVGRKTEGGMDWTPKLND